MNRIRLNATRRNRIVPGLAGGMLSYLLNDEFSVDADPIVVPLAADIAGQWTYKQSAPIIADGALVCNAGDNLHSAQTHENGITAYFSPEIWKSGSPRRWSGWSDATALDFMSDPRGNDGVFVNGAEFRNALVVGLMGDSWHVLESASTGYIFDNTTGGTVKLRFAAFNLAFTDLRINHHNNGGIGETGTEAVRCAVLSSFATTSYITDSISGAWSGGEAFTHIADCFFSFVLSSLPSSGVVDIVFRKQDASNYWSIQVNSSGDLLLVETVAGSPTTRDSSLAALAGTERIYVRCDDSTIEAWESGANARALNYGSASNFKTATSGEVLSLGTGGGAGNLDSVPIYPSGAYLSQLQQIAAGS